MYLLGQLFGLVGTVITLIQPQFQRKTQILVCCILNNTANALNFFLIGQTGSAVSLCLVAVAQSLLSLWHERKKSTVSPAETALFFALYVGCGGYGLVCSEDFAWRLDPHTLLELLPLLGALMLMASVFAKGEQRTRVFLLLNGVAWLFYTALTGSTVFFSCVASTASTLLALWKYRRDAEG